MASSSEAQFVEQLRSVLGFLQENFPDAAEVVLRDLKQQQEQQQRQEDEQQHGSAREAAAAAAAATATDDDEAPASLGDHYASPRDREDAHSEHEFGSEVVDHARCVGRGRKTGLGRSGAICRRV